MIQVARLLMSRYVEHVLGRAWDNSRESDSAKSRVCVCSFEKAKRCVCGPTKTMLVEQGGSKHGSSFGAWFESFRFLRAPLLGFILASQQGNRHVFAVVLFFCLFFLIIIIIFFGGGGVVTCLTPGATLSAMGATNSIDQFSPGVKHDSKTKGTRPTPRKDTRIFLEGILTGELKTCLWCRESLCISSEACLTLNKYTLK